MSFVLLTDYSTDEKVYINLDLAVRIDQVGTEDGGSIHFLGSGFGSRDIAMRVKETPEWILQILANSYVY